MSKYTKLESVIKNTNQLTIQEIVNERFYHKKRGWVKLNMSGELKQQAIEMAIGCLGGTKNTKDEMRYRLHQWRIQHWGLGRLIFILRNGKAYCTYCAGQDYDSELRTIRKALSK